MNERISTLQLFCRVARTGSFTEAGKEVNLSQPSVSRIISSFEKKLGVALFVRSTHAVNLTDVGAEYLDRIEPLLASLEEANHLARGDGSLQGRLRVGAATSFAMRELIPRMSDFLTENPKVNVDFVLTDSRQDLIDQGLDVAVRFGPLKDSSLIARKIGETPRLVVASPDYLARMGTPMVPADLATHKAVLGPSSIGVPQWIFKKQGEVAAVRMESQVMATVNEATTAAALSGLGVVLTALWGCKTELDSGQLVQILPDWDLGTVEVNALLLGGIGAKPSAHAFVDYLVASFRESKVK